MLEIKIFVRQGSQSFNDLLIITSAEWCLHALALMSPLRGLRRLGNIVGFAWWAKVETNEPKATYWFGPFLTRRSLQAHLSTFVEDLSVEGSDSIKHSMIRGSRGEPLTI